MKRTALPLLLAGLAISGPSFAIDGYFVDVGGSHRLQSVKVGMIRQWQERWLNRQHWHLTGYWETALAYLHSDGPDGKNVADASITPVFRLRPDASGGVQPYLDAGIGAHLLTSSKVDDKHDLGSAFQLGPLFGLGVTFGDKSQYDFGYRYMRLTNAGTHQPATGLDLHEVRLTYLY